MTATGKPLSVYECVVAVSAELAADGIAKTRSNQQQGYAFRGIDDVLNALSPLLVKYRLVILPRILSRTVSERATQKGGTLFYVVVEAEFDFVSASDGSKHTVKTYGEAMDSADKATNKAMSAAYKYAAFQTFCIPTEGDNDADAHSHELAERRIEPPATGTATGARAAAAIPPGPASSVQNEGHSGLPIVSNVNPGRAGAEAEIEFDNGDRYLTWKKQVKADAERFKHERTPCVVEFKRSASGNQRIESLTAASKTGAPTAERVYEDQIPF